MRTQIIAGNWKMHMNRADATVLVEGVKEGLSTADTARQVVFCPPFTALCTVSDLLEDTGLALGAQNMFHEESGAYTGEIAPTMLTDVGVQYVILGHSERRTIFKEGNRCINKRVKKALEHGLTPILCVGESLEQREQGETMSFITSQLEEGLADISGDDVASMVIAYEPIWAIGTGKTATAEQANEVCEAIRSEIARLYNEAVAEQLHIQYGGSVKGSNAKEILEQPHIDGVLVGGASLQVEEFLAIITA